MSAAKLTGPVVPARNVATIATQSRPVPRSAVIRCVPVAVTIRACVVIRDRSWSGLDDDDVVSVSLVNPPVNPD